MTGTKPIRFVSALLIIVGLAVVGPAKGGGRPVILAQSESLEKAQGGASQSQLAEPVAAAVPAPPSEADNSFVEIAQEADRLKAQVAELWRNFKPEALQDRELNDLRETVQRIMGKASELEGAARPRLAEFQARLDQLGLAPAAGQPPEPDATANERKALNEQLAHVSHPVRTAEDAKWEAGNLLDRINRQRRILFAERLMHRVASPLSPALWRDVNRAAEAGLRKLEAKARVWRDKLLDEEEFYAAAAIAVLIWLLTSTLAFWGIDRFRAWEGQEPPPFWKRATSAAWGVLFAALPPIATAGVFYFFLKIFGLLDEDIEKILLAVVAAVSIAAAVNALAVTLLAPSKPVWRIFVASDKIAARIRWLTVGMAAVFGADLIMSELNEVLAAPLVLSIAQSVVASVAFALIGLTLFLLPSNGIEVEGTADLRWLRFLRWPFAAVALAILVCALIGYVALARLLAAQIVVTGTILIILYLSFLAIEAFSESLKDENSGAGAWLQNDLDLDERRRGQVALPVMLVLKIAAIAAAVPLLMLQLGFDWDDVQRIMGQAFSGFTVGSMHISISALVAAFLVFLIAYTLARLFQEWLDRRVLARAGMSGSARDSIRTGIGYAGIVAAGVVAFSYAGVSFSNFALVAGALSVGVGLGLQGVVNNFVSGLILLAERPIRVGDWIDIGGEEGIVRKISVRATEVETFDKAALVIPNSILISSKVKNWTLHNDMGRTFIPVSVAVDSDAEQVREILARVAKEHPEVLTAPAPVVYFENFTANSLDFRLYVYLLNITRSIAVRTELRLAILKAFREQGVHVPHTPFDVFMTDFHGAALELARKLAEDRGEANVTLLAADGNKNRRKN